MNLPSDKHPLSTYSVEGTALAPDVPVPFGRTTFRGGYCDEKAGLVKRRLYKAHS